MVLSLHNAKRIVSNVENTPPGIPAKYTPVRFRSSTHTTASQRRRARANGYPTTKYAEQAVRRCKAKQPSQLQFKVRSIGPVADVEMTDVSTSLPSGSNTIPVMLPRELGRTDFVEVSREALVAVDPELTEMSPIFLRENLDIFGPEFLKSLSSVRASAPSETLPKELSIVVTDLSATLPSHMLAVYGPAQPSQKKRKVTLYPAHSLYLAAHCAHLPVFPPVEKATPVPGPDATEVRYTVPVRPLCLPSPATYPRLSSFLYTKNTNSLLASLLPAAPPSTLLSPTSRVSSPSPESEEEPTEEEEEAAKLQRAAEHRKAITDFAYSMAGTYTPQLLLQHALTVHGLWQNVCALGIFHSGLWDVIDIAWATLLSAMAVGTGKSVEEVLGKDQILEKN